MNGIPIRAGCHKIPKSSADILFLFALVFVAALLVPPLLFVLPLLFFLLLIFFFREFFPLIGPKSEYILVSVSPRSPPL
jgi:hypothetical protein